MTVVTRNFTEQEWWTKANRQAKWKVSFGVELRALEAQVERVNDIRSLQKIIDRIEAIERRLAQLQMVMQRHLAHAPDLLPGLQSAAHIGARVQ